MHPVLQRGCQNAVPFRHKGTFPHEAVPRPCASETRARYVTICGRPCYASLTRRRWAARLIVACCSSVRVNRWGPASAASIEAHLPHVILSALVPAGVGRLQCVQARTIPSPAQRSGWPCGRDLRSAKDCSRTHAG